MKNDARRGGMNAVEFFRKHGVEESKKHLKWMEDVKARRDIHGDFMDDLKRLVESWKLVGKLGGIEKAKTYVPDRYKSKRLKQAIADVESVGGGV